MNADVLKEINALNEKQNIITDVIKTMNEIKKDNFNISSINLKLRNVEILSFEDYEKLIDFYIEILENNKVKIIDEMESKKHLL